MPVAEAIKKPTMRVKFVNKIVPEVRYSIKEIQLEVLVEEEIPEPYGIYCYLHEFTLLTNSGKRIVVMVDMNSFCNITRDTIDHHKMLVEYVNFDNVIDVMMFNADGGFGGVPTADDWTDIKSVTEAKINSKWSTWYIVFRRKRTKACKLTPTKILSMDIKFGELEINSIDDEVVIQGTPLNDTTVIGY